MEMKWTAAIVLFLIAHMNIGVARRCYVGVHNTTRTESECNGSCMTVKTGGFVVVGCNNFTIGAGCMTVESDQNVLMCLCNDALCNEFSTSEPKTTGEAFKCYEGLQGYYIQETECEGSCMTVRKSQNDITLDYSGCIPSIRGNICLRAFGYTTCLCDSSLCNNGTIQALPDTPTNPANPSSAELSGFSIPGTGRALKCYFGEEGGKVTEIDCGGSCTAYEFTDNKQKATIYGCSPFPTEETCMTTRQSKTCSCNRNLCNQNGISGMGTHLSFIYMVICFVVAKAFSS